MRLCIPLLLLAVSCSASPARAHYHMLLPSTHSAKKDEKVTFTYQFGHPFEHQLFDAMPPTSLTVLTPDGKKADLTKELKKVERKGDKGQKVTAFEFDYTPKLRGDHVFVLVSARTWMEEEKDFIQDTVKVILHVQTQKGWDADAGKLEFIPLTRPYGLIPGMVFQAEMVDRAILALDRPLKLHPLAGAMTEVERYNPTPPAKLPPDEHITRTVKLDRLGKAITTLPDAGWWALTVTSPHPHTLKVKDKVFPMRFRSTLWVFVDEAPAKK